MRSTAQVLSLSQSLPQIEGYGASCVQFAYGSVLLAFGIVSAAKTLSAILKLPVCAANHCVGAA